MKLTDYARGKPHVVDCSYPAEHADHHHEHPATNRLVCHICHTPSYVLEELTTHPEET